MATSRTQAQRLVEEGMILVAGVAATKPATMVDATTPLLIRENGATSYASRGGHKLAGALERLDVDVTGRFCLDAGAAHGGFTDVLLRRGAARVVAVDVAYGQLDWRLRADDRVVVLERTNVRFLDPADVPPPPAEIIVADLSFISLTLVLPALYAVMDPAGEMILLVKPQFEAGKHAVGKGGVVRDPEVWSTAIHRVVAAAAELGLGLRDACVSPLPGPSGNIEFFVHLRAGAITDFQKVVADAVAEGVTLRGAERG
jgi:23S rRNA (cytidine1920-2'-O)/16S rRNA (cytidine1409-2'-O)-methyltransferase